MSQKIGFWSVLALVTGSQIGTGILILPASIASFGILGILGWVISCAAAIILSLMFAILCQKLPYTGGPHVYLKYTFGNTAAFFTGWTYWIISWVSSTTVVISAIRYLSPLIGEYNSVIYLGLEILLLIGIMLINLKGIQIAGRIEFILASLKFIPLIIVPIAALLYNFTPNNFFIEIPESSLNTTQIIGQVVLLTFWGFIGLESATTQTNLVINPKITIPKAVVFGTICVAILYLINHIAIVGLIPYKTLSVSNAPYVDATQIIFGGQWHLIISIIAATICIGTLNAWVLTSSQIALGLAENKLMPQIFSKKNTNNAPTWSIIISCIGIIPLLIITENDNLSEQINEIIDFSVTAFLFVYLACSIAFIKIILLENQHSKFQLFIAITSCIFCSWTIYETSIKTLFIASLFTCTGIPIYYFFYKKVNYSQNP